MNKYVSLPILSHFLDKLKTVFADINNVLYKTPQELTKDEINQVRENLHTVGQYATGLTYYPYTPEETSDDLVFNRTDVQDGVVAAEGAEIFNDYENNLATGYYAIASGFGTQATGDFSNASGWLTQAGGYCSISSGRRTNAQGAYAHSEGIDTSASKNAAHAEGEGCQATAHRSHAEGYYTQATTNQAHAEGMYSIASGVNSHAEGWSCTAKGQNSFAGGKYTQATATNSFANGLYTVAKGAQQVVHGKYNISDTTSSFIIGNGAADDVRSNSMTIDDSGNGWFSGDVYVGSTSGTNKDDGSEKLATESYVDASIQSNTVLELIYPIGSVYISTIEANPNTLFGFGTWEQIKDVFLLSAGDTYTAGETGGEAEHVLTEDEMPSHRHKLKTDIYNPTYNETWSEWFEYTDGWTQDGSETEAPPTHTTYVGGDLPHNNMPPYLAVYVYKRVS